MPVAFRKPDPAGGRARLGLTMDSVRHRFPPTVPVYARGGIHVLIPMVQAADLWDPDDLAHVSALHGSPASCVLLETEVRARRKLYNGLMRALPAKKAARYLQLEAKIRTVQAYDIASAIPLRTNDWLSPLLSVSSPVSRFSPSPL